MSDPIGSTVEPFLAAVDQALGNRYSAVLYGSVARGDYFPATSDINLLLVLDEAGPATLRALQPAFEAWRARTPEPPLILSRAEWARASDVFPIELTDMQAAHRILRGSDPLMGAVVHRADLRRALEGELRGKLLRLRQGYTLLAQHPAELGRLAVSSAPTALVLFRCLLTLAGRPAADPADARGIVTASAASAGFPADPVLEVVTHRGDTGWRCPSDRFEAYLDAIVRTAQYVDQLHPGDAS